MKPCMSMSMLLPIALAAACSAPAPPPPEQHTELRRAVERPLDQAKQVEAIQQQAEADRRKQLDEAER